MKEMKAFIVCSIVCLLLGHTFAALGIVQDDLGEKTYHWSGGVRFLLDEDTVVSQLPSLARQAYEEMIKDVKDKNIANKRTPAIMAAFAVPREDKVGVDVQFSSSLRARSEFLINPTMDGDEFVVPGVAEEVKLAILRCQQTYTVGHRFATKCGEPLAIQQYLVNNKDQSVADRGKIAAYGLLGDGIVGIKDPCKPEEIGQWGCQIFLDKIKVSKVGKEGERPDLPSIEPDGEIEHCLWKED